MDTKKILILLISFVVLVNYVNYIMPDRNELADQIVLLKNKIDREKRLNDMKLVDQNLTIPEAKLFFSAKRYSYSKAMGEFQQIITDAIKGNCHMRNIKWAQVPSDNGFYERLSLNTVLECKPKKFFLFVNRLRDQGKLITFDNLLIGAVPKKDILIVSFQSHGFRMKDE